MNCTKNNQAITSFFTVSIVLALLLALHNDLAIPGPLPESTILTSQAKASAQEARKRRFRKENMSRILSGYHTGLLPSEDRELVDFIVEESRQYGFEPELILALISTESSFYNWSVSNKGALGMMQIVPETGKALAKATQIAWNELNQLLFDPYVNIRLGIHYLHALNKRFGNIHVALAAYNFGPTKIQRWIRQGKPIPTGYSNKVIRFYKSYLARNLENQKIHKFTTQVNPSILTAPSDT